MGHRLAASLTCVVAMSALTAAGPADPPARQVVLGFFERHSTQNLDAFLAGLRPAPLDPVTRSHVLDGLPKEGALLPSPAELEKIAAAAVLLKYSAREGAISFQVIDLNHAFVGLYQRTVVLVSRQLLNMVSPPEFVAFVAHEVGHDYDWEDYFSAMQKKNRVRMQQLELRADAIAVLTLKRIGGDPEDLVSAVRNVTYYNLRRNAVENARDYVPLTQRVAFIRAVAKLEWAEPTTSR
jgi:Zn-dependent protease with chaperone function